MSYTVIGKREVPVTVTHRGLITGKTVTEHPVHGGQKAVCVRLDSGYSGWGFADTWEGAESEAVKEARRIESSNPTWCQGRR